MWEQLIAELAPHGVTAVAVSLDAEPADAEQWLDEAELSFPSVIDADMRTAEWFGIVNVPTAVWFDERGQMVRPPTIAPGDDRFKDFSGVDSSVHHDALRRWAVEGEPIDPQLMTRWRQPVAEAPAAARAHRKIATWLHRQDDADGAAHHFARAAMLAPNDWTIRRGSMPLQGQDPFGDAFFSFAQDWHDSGRQSYSDGD